MSKQKTQLYRALKTLCPAARMEAVLAQAVYQ